MLYIYSAKNHLKYVNEIKKLDDEHIKNIKNIEINPIFILGLPRSGTSILYKILTKTKCFNYINSYNIIYYDQLIHNQLNNKEDKKKKELNRYFEKIGIKERNTDKQKIHADFPEEYGYILNTRRYETHITKKNLDLFLEICKKIQYISKNSKPILLKNTSEFQNISYIKKVIPNAKFIFICRNPLKIINSSMNAIKILINEKNSYYEIIQPNYNKFFDNFFILTIGRIFFNKIPIIGLNYILNIYSNQTRQFKKGFKNIKRSDKIIVKYEDLCSNPKQEIEKIMNYFKIEKESNLNFESYIKKRKLELLPVIVKMKRLVYKKLKLYYDFFGYKLE